MRDKIKRKEKTNVVFASFLFRFLQF
uniref:Uncharacterized protein n=1 Tax=Rhizophora mucronata TaxID=61149 RepID=A0A2P2QP02_RHIMU